MRFEDALAWLDRHVNLERTTGRVAGAPTLDRVARLVAAMGNPQRSQAVIHITGTNGKGTVARMIHDLLGEHQLAVGLFTSPHLMSITERLVRNGVPITEDEFAHLIEQIQSVAEVLDREGTGDPPTYFELLVAAAYWWFAQEAVDVAVVEVGMLGRWDATNVADGRVAVVTNVGIDHLDYATSLQAVAQEKAGIVKPESTLVIGDVDHRLVQPFLDAGAARVVRLGNEFDVESNQIAVGGRLLDIRTPAGEYENVLVPLHGAHQGANVATAVMAVEAFFDRALDPELVRHTFAVATAPGRFEVATHEPLIVLDVAHNPDAAARTSATFRDEFTGHEPRVIVFGMLRGRNPAEVLGALNASLAELVIVCQPDSPRAMPAEMLAMVANEAGCSTEVVHDPVEALTRAVSVTTSEDTILVVGSFQVVGPVRAELARIAES